MYIHKWISQKPELIKDIPAANRAAELDPGKKEFPLTKDIEVVWIAQADSFLLLQLNMRKISIDKANCYYL